MKLPYRGILADLALLAAVLLLPVANPLAQNYTYPGGPTPAPNYSYGSPTPSSGGSGYSSSMSYFQTGAEGTLYYPSGLNFKVPLSLTGHAFALKYVQNATVMSTNASVLGIITEIATPGSTSRLRSISQWLLRKCRRP